MSPDENGFYWLHREGHAPAVGKFEGGLWAIVGQAAAVSGEVLEKSEYRVGRRIGSPRSAG